MILKAVGGGISSIKDRKGGQKTPKAEKAQQTSIKTTIAKQTLNTKPS